jgi:hypothetical protein
MVRVKVITTKFTRKEEQQHDKTKARQAKKQDKA